MSLISRKNEEFKDKKENLINWAGQSRYNHPHRLTGISVSGSFDYTIDERDFTSPGTSADLYVYDIDFSLANSAERIFIDKFPWRGSTPPVEPDADEVVLAHQPLEGMWEIIPSYGANGIRPTREVVGTLTVTPYTRPTTGDPWVAGTPVETDMEFSFGMFISGGGEPASGGRGDDSSDEETQITFSDSWIGTGASNLPDFGVVLGRLPWDDPWSSETAEFSTILSDFISAANTADGGGHSGSTTLSLDFTS